jgi:hypothetical protein
MRLRASFPCCLRFRSPFRSEQDDLYGGGIRILGSRIYALDDVSSDKNEVRRLNWGVGLLSVALRTP